ncbi:MAG: ankyrin repeat domain-containing protein [Betaproteobacteria bacterium]|nr:ankyrin repeat domain-containing protein [Betaproteobacteria bacterium]
MRMALAGALLAFLAGPNAAATDIHGAIRAGDVEAVRAAASDNSELNRPDNWGRTPLIVALQQGRTALVAMLVGRGASVSATDAWGRTPLLVATQLKNTAAIRLLLEQKADVNAANKNDITPLISAAQTGNAEALQVLLAAGAAPDRTDNLGWTALMWAAYRNNQAIVKMLLDKGADTRWVARDQSTAVSRARGRGADAALIAALESAAQSGATARPATAAAQPAAPKATAAAATARPTPALDPARIIRGNPRAAITIFEYTDFQCPYCGYGAKTLNEVMARYEGQVRMVVKHLPLPLLHPMAMACAQYFEAISLQSPDKAWAFYDRLFEDQRALAGAEPYLQKVAAGLGVDMGRLQQDLRNPVTQGRIAADLKESERFKFDGVPAFIIDGDAIEGAQPADRFFEVIDKALHR